jgi:hypothetical protein
MSSTIWTKFFDLQNKLDLLVITLLQERFVSFSGSRLFVEWNLSRRLVLSQRLIFLKAFENIFPEISSFFRPPLKSIFKSSKFPINFKISYYILIELHINQYVISTHIISHSYVIAVITKNNNHLGASIDAYNKAPSYFVMYGHQL